MSLVEPGKLNDVKYHGQYQKYYNRHFYRRDRYFDGIYEYLIHPYLRLPQRKDVWTSIDTTVFLEALYEKRSSESEPKKT